MGEPGGDPSTRAAAPGPVGERLVALTARLRERGSTPPTDTDLHGWQAATALVLAPGEHDIEVAIIERAHRPGDRWSGHLALPGGRREHLDLTLAETAARESEEEVGLALGPAVTRIAAHRARVRPGVVACYAFVLDRPQAMTPQPTEVANAWWVPLGSLTDPGNAITVRHTGIPFPAIDVQGRALWGLTLKLLQRFADLAELELASR